MSLRLNKNWRQLNQAAVDQLKGELGVFQLADANKEVTFVGYAGSCSIFGLRSEIRKHIDTASYYRTEITSAYSTRFQELLMLHYADFGSYPSLNSESETSLLGRLSPQ